MRDRFGNEIKFASLEGVSAYAAEIEQINQALRKPMQWDDEAYSWLYVSDRSSFAEFALNDAQVAEISAALGVPIAGSETLLEVAKLLRIKKDC